MNTFVRQCIAALFDQSRFQRQTMLDLETLGTETDSPIAAIGAVHFDQSGPTDEGFYTVVDLKTSVEAGARIDPEAVIWWMQQSDQARQLYSETVQEQKIPLALALRQLNDYLGAGSGVWGNGAAFDNAIMNKAYNQCGIKPDWAFRNDLCYRSMKTIFPVEHERRGIYHHALDDARYQAEHLAKIFNAITAED